MVTFEGHAFKSYDSALSNIRGTLLDMGDTVEQLLTLIEQGFVAEDNANKQAKQLRKEVTNAEEIITKEIMKIISSYNPQYDELRFLLTTIKAANTLERMSSISRNVIKRCNRLEETIPADTTSTLSTMLKLTHTMLTHALSMIENFDNEKAREVYKADDEVDTAYENLFNSLQNDLHNAPQNAPFVHQLILIAKDVERIADHAFMLTKMEYFIHTGERPKKKQFLEEPPPVANTSNAS